MHKFWRHLSAILLALVLTACSASYPESHLEDSVRELFKKEMNSSVQVRRVGKTLYAGLVMDSMMDKNMEIAPDTFSKLESALLSISRIALSTDAKIDFVVVQLGDQTSQMVLSIVRCMQDLKDLFYWRISQPDFQERIVLETERFGAGVHHVQDEKSGKVVRKGFVDENLWGQPWSDISYPLFWTRLVSSRLNWRMNSNMLLKILMGNLDSFESRWEEKTRTLYLTIRSTAALGQQDKILSDLLRDMILDEMAAVEIKYLERPEWKGKSAWAEKLEIQAVSSAADQDAKPSVKTLAVFDRKIWLDRTEKLKKIKK